MLHQGFINMIKSSHSQAHPGNVNQLLEAFNELANMKDVESVIMEREFDSQRLVVKCKMLNDTFMQYVHESSRDADIRCMDLCIAVGKLMNDVKCYHKRGVL